MSKNLPPLFQKSVLANNLPETSYDVVKQAKDHLSSLMREKGMMSSKTFNAIGVSHDDSGFYIRIRTAHGVSEDMHTQMQELADNFPYNVRVKIDCDGSGPIVLLISDAEPE
jgi:predicted nucleic acid-binding Zn ribbon protein